MRLTHRAFHFAASAALLACFGLGWCVSAQQPSSPSIVGRWRWLDTTKGGVGAMYEYHADGTVDFSPGAIVEARWRIENGLLVLPAERTACEEKHIMKWLGENQLRLETITGSEEFTRVGDRSDAAHPLIGEWTQWREVAGQRREIHWLFYPGGKLLFMLPFETDRGSYVISGSTLHIDFHGRDTEFRVNLAGDQMTVTEVKSGRVSRYARY